MKMKLPSEILLLIFAITLLGSKVVYAVDFDSGNVDTSTFDQVLQPVMKIYSFIKYAASAVAGIVLLLAGITYMTSGGNPGKRETAKNMATFVVVGLIVIWATPFIVNYIAA